jgi:hypothetical protein
MIENVLDVNMEAVSLESQTSIDQSVTREERAILDQLSGLQLTSNGVSVAEWHSFLRRIGFLILVENKEEYVYDLFYFEQTEDITPWMGSQRIGRIRWDEHSLLVHDIDNTTSNDDDADEDSNGTG